MSTKQAAELHLVLDSSVPSVTGYSSSLWLGHCITIRSLIIATLTQHSCKLHCPYLLYKWKQVMLEFEWVGNIEAYLRKMCMWTLVNSIYPKGTTFKI